MAPDISYDEQLTKAAKKRHRFNKDVIKNEEKEFYCLHYSQKTKAEFLPGSDEPFKLQRYKEEIGKPYIQRLFYIYVVGRNIIQLLLMNLVIAWATKTVMSFFMSNCNTIKIVLKQ